jgi:uncharacterized protein YbjQ (UPF0145 family)
MKRDILLSTTASIPNYEVIESKGLVFANVVLGTNFFSDFAASFTDTFGGTSDTYQGKLDKIYNEVIEKLSKKALAIGCNAIIGFKIDFDEISGKGVSMFMVNAVGTACKAKQIAREKAVSNGVLLDEEDLENAVQKYKIIHSIKEKKQALIPDETQEYLIDHPTKEIVDELLDYYYVVKVSNGGGYVSGGVYVADETPKRVVSNIKFINQYIGLILDEEVIDKIYSKYEQNDVYIQIIEQSNIFDCKHVLQIAEQDPFKALPLLGIKKGSYSKEDIIYFKQIISKYENLPNRGSIEMSKGGMFSKSQKQYICEYGHANDEDVEFCKKCGKNIQGLTQEDIENINDIKLKIEALENYFK